MINLQLIQANLSFEEFTQTIKECSYSTVITLKLWSRNTTFRLKLKTLNNLMNMRRWEGVQRRHNPRKNDRVSGFAELPPGPAKLVSQPLVTSPSLILAPIKKHLAFISTKNLFLKNSQHDEIVQNDTLTFCIKK